MSLAPLQRSRLLLAVLTFFSIHEAGCDTGIVPTDSGSSAGPDLALANGSNDGGTPDLAAAPGDMAIVTMVLVTFTYVPRWNGVTSVAVLGGFGQPTDWTQPLLTLTGGQGAFSANVMLPAGQYPYVFKVTGDDAGTKGFSRYAVDPWNSAFVPCPAAAPTFDKNAPNPCSLLDTAAPAPGKFHNVTGKVTLDGKGAPGYLVEIERDEPKSHHFFANRMTAQGDGSYGFMVVDGTYRLQVLHPTSLVTTDASRDPFVLQSMKRAISSGFAVSGGATVTPVEVAYHDYDKMTPAAMGADGGAPADGGTNLGAAQATLPVTFKYTLVDGATTARAAVYGPGKNVGDPWFASMYAAATSAVWDGKFTTAQAMETQAKPGEIYYWGTWQNEPHPDGGVAWTGQSMVLPITVK